MRMVDHLEVLDLARDAGLGLRVLGVHGRFADTFERDALPCQDMFCHYPIRLVSSAPIQTERQREREGVKIRGSGDETYI